MCCNGTNLCLILNFCEMSFKNGLINTDVVTMDNTKVP